VHLVGVYYKNISRCTVLWMLKEPFSFIKKFIVQPACNQQKRNLKQEIYYTKSLKSKIIYHNQILYVNWPWIGKGHNFDIAALRTTSEFCTRVGTLIVATIYLQLIQNRYMFRSFTVVQCSHQHCVQPVASDVEVVGYL